MTMKFSVHRVFRHHKCIFQKDFLFSICQISFSKRRSNNSRLSVYFPRSFVEKFLLTNARCSQFINHSDVFNIPYTPLDPFLNSDHYDSKIRRDVGAIFMTFYEFQYPAWISGGKRQLNQTLTLSLWNSLHGIFSFWMGHHRLRVLHRKFIILYGSFFVLFMMVVCRRGVLVLLCLFYMKLYILSNNIIDIIRGSFTGREESSVYLNFWWNPNKQKTRKCPLFEKEKMLKNVTPTDFN